MMSTITNKTFQFLQDLKTHNKRDWFKANKPGFEEAKMEFESFIAELLPHIAKSVKCQKVCFYHNIF